MDGFSALTCETFTLAIRTWEADKVCQEGIDKSNSDVPLFTSPDNEARTEVIRISKSQKQ